MDRLFLDANVLFSAAYQSRSGIHRLWKLRDAILCTSRYAVEEARVNLDSGEQRLRLDRLFTSLELFDAPEIELPAGIALPEKDAPIFLAAMAARATHLLTGDVRHFGAYLGKRISGILVMLPGEYLRLRGII